MGKTRRRLGNPSGRERLAEMEHDANGSKLAYAESLDGDPILKMLVLAALVSGGPS